MNKITLPTLDDRIYCLQRTLLPMHLQVLVKEADEEYLQNRDDNAENIVKDVETFCEVNGFDIFIPELFELFQSQISDNRNHGYNNNLYS